VDSGPVVFPVSGFPRKNLGVDLCDCCIIFVHCFDSVFYCTKREKGLGLVNCELYSAELIWLVVPSFPNNLSPLYMRKETDTDFGAPGKQPNKKIQAPQLPNQLNKIY